MTVKLKPHHIYSVRQERIKDLLFLDEKTIIFPSLNNCVCYNIHQRWTKFIPGSMPYQEGPQSIKALAISPDRHYLAVSERGERTTITVYDLQCEHCSKRQVLTDDSNHEFVCMAFSADSKYLVGQSGEPKWTLFYWDWENNEVIATVKSTSAGFVSQVSFNPKDNTQICVTGNSVFEIFKLENESINRTGSFTDLKNVSSHTWMSEDCIILGKETGELVMLKAGNRHNLKRTSSQSQEENGDQDTSTSSIPALQRISAITTYSKGFVCAAGPVVCLYEKTEKCDYTSTMEIRIPEDLCSSEPELQEITAVCMSPLEQTLAISTRQGQVYHFSITSTEISQDNRADFDFLFHPWSINDLSTCSSKPLFATCSKDNSIRVWNYKTNILELNKTFPEEPKCISLHPNGLSLLVCFNDKVCLMNMLVDGFRTVKEFNILNCSVCVFNNDGNMFATVIDNLISVFHVITGNCVDFKGHFEKIKSLKWSEDDHLVSCGVDGAVFVWKVLNISSYTWKAVIGPYETVSTETSCTFVDAIFSPDTRNVLAIGSDFTLKEFQEKEALQLVPKSTDEVDCTVISMTHSGKAVFAGTAAGSVKVLQYPIEEGKSWIEYQADSASIAKMAITPDDQYLLTASIDGSFHIWIINDQGGCTLSMWKETADMEEVLCTKDFLEKQKQRIHPDAYNQVALLKQEHEHRINEIRQSFCQEIEALKSQIQELNAEKEGQNYEELEKSMLAMQQYYMEILNEQEKMNYQCTMYMKRHFDDRLHDQENKLQQAEKRIKELEKNIDSEYKDVILQYEQKLQAETKSKAKSEKEMKLMENKFWKLKEELQEQCQGSSQLEAKVAEIDSKKRKTIHDLEQELKHQEQELYMERNKATKMTILVQRMKADIQECLSFIHKPCQLKENFIRLHKSYIKEADVALRAKPGVVQDHIRLMEHKQFLEANVQQSYSSKVLMQLQNRFEEINMENMETISELRLKLTMNEKELSTERQMVKNIKCLVESMKEDIKICISFIQCPSLLKENVLKLYKSYIQEADVRVGAKTAVVKDHTMPKAQQQTMVVTPEKKLAVDANIQPAQSSTLLKPKVKADEVINNMESMFDLRQKLTMKEKELCIEKQRVKDIKTLVCRMKDDIKTCSGFIQQPKMLKENFKKLHKNYIQDADKIHLKDMVKLPEQKQNEADLTITKNQQDGLKEEQKEQMRLSDDPELSELQDKIQEKKQLFSKLESEVDKINLKNMFDLRQKVIIKEKELCIERQKVKNLMTLAKKMRDDIESCSRFIQQPKKLKEYFINIHRNYIQEANYMKVGAVVQDQIRLKDQQKRTVVTPEKKQQQADTVAQSS